MSGKRRRFVDAHVHLWDAAANPWYNFPQPSDEGDGFGLGLKRPFPDRYMWDDHLASTCRVQLEKWVHVTALTRPNHIEAETAWVDSIALQIGLPFVLIGSVDMSRDIREIIASLDRQAASPAFRGIRLLEGADYSDVRTRELLSQLSSRGLIYEVVVSTGSIASAAQALSRYPDLTVILEHAGWPLAYDEVHFRKWRDEMEEFARLPNSFCKLSGLAMVVHRNDLNISRKFYEKCIALFGSDRCMFGSNFPVDLSYDEGSGFFSVFEEIASSLREEQAEDLYFRTAERAYRL